MKSIALNIVVLCSVIVFRASAIHYYGKTCGINIFVPSTWWKLLTTDSIICDTIDRTIKHSTNLMTGSFGILFAQLVKYAGDNIRFS